MLRLGLCEREVHRVGSGGVFSTLITQRQRINTGKEVFTGAKEDRPDRDMQLVDESGLEVLPDRRDTTADLNILAVGCLGCALQRGMDSVCVEVKGRAALHGDGLPRVIG